MTFYSVILYSTFQTESMIKCQITSLVKAIFRNIIMLSIINSPFMN